MLLAKRFLFCCIGLFMAYQSYQTMYVILVRLSDNAPYAIQAFVAFILSLYVTGAFAFTGFVLPTHRVLGKRYYIISNPKLLKRIYHALRIDVFRKLLLFFFWGRGKNRKQYFNGTRSGLKTFAYQSYQSEFGHFGAFVVLCIACGVLVAYGQVFIALLCLILNFIGNLYPVILQRYHRIRINSILQKREIH